MLAVVSPPAYWSAVGVSLLACLGVSLVARRRPGPWRVTAARVIGSALVADVITYSISEAQNGSWSAKTDLPLALCDVAALVAALACWWRIPLLVELTYFWGLAGTLQAVITPDLNVGFPHLVFFEYLVGHLGIVCAALFLVIGLGMRPRPRAVPRVFAITALYTAFVGLIDGLTGANYMFLRQPPGEWTVLRLLGPWPWYTLSAAGVALGLLLLLDWPFWRTRRDLRAQALSLT
ncbi:MAG TPA: TIGR02206 family membrane protein [Acidimicrobiales bacterium]